MHGFSNQTIPLSDIPQYQATPLNPLDAAYKKVVLYNYIFILFILLVLAALAFKFNIFYKIPLIFATGFALVILFFSLFFNLKAITLRGYAFRQHDIINYSGFIVKKTTVVPNNRIQHVSIQQGIFSRLFNLCSLKIYTASTGTSDIIIHGITYHDALRYKAFILNKIHVELHD